MLRGELAVVGPRPTLEAQVELYTPRQRRRLEVKPGITGWAQVNGRAGIPWDERIELDVWYVDNRTRGWTFASSPVPHGCWPRATGSTGSVGRDER